MSDSCEQKARDLLERLSGATHYADPQRLSAGDVVELAQLFAEIERLEDRLRAARGGCKILSHGDECDCGLCKREREIKRLRGEAERMASDNMVPVDRKWLEAIGELKNDTIEIRVQTCCRDFDCIELWQVEEDDDDDYSDARVAALHRYPITRGDVRLLCMVLDVPCSKAENAGGDA